MQLFVLSLCRVVLLLLRYESPKTFIVKVFILHSLSTCVLLSSWSIILAIFAYLAHLVGCYWYNQFSCSVQLLSRVRLFATPWIAARQASLSITNFQSSLKLTSMESVMASSHSYSVIPFSSCPQSLPASESFPMSQLFAWGGQSTWTRVILCIMSIKFISLWTVLWQRMKSLLWSWVRMVDTYCCLPHASEKCFWFFFLIEMGRNAFPRSVVKYHDLKLYQSALVKILQPATHCDWCYYLVEYLAVHSHLPSSIWLLCLPD